MRNTRMLIQRETFNQTAEDYDSIRPGYPDRLIEDIIKISNISNGGRILEIGCGTGQATLPFAKYGYSMLCLDIGKELITIAQNKLRPYKQVHFQKVSFEDWKVEEDAFDLIIAATSFHWISLDIGYKKAAQALCDTGFLAVFSNQHPFPSSGFFHEVQEIYDEIVPEWGEKSKKKVSFEEKLKRIQDDFNKTGLFESVLVNTYPWEQSYTANDYLKLLNTYSDHHSLLEEKRLKLFERIKNLIDTKYKRKITKQYVAVLYLAKKKQTKGSGIRVH